MLKWLPLDSNPWSSYHELYLLQANPLRVFMSKVQISQFYTHIYIYMHLFFYFQWVDIFISNKMRYLLPRYFLCPRHKMARGHLVFALSVLPSFRPSVTSKFVFSTPPTSLHGFEWNLAGMLYHKSRSAFGEIIHVRQILAELWSLTLIILTHFSLSSQFLLHPCMDSNETLQGCCTTSQEVHVGR